MTADYVWGPDEAHTGLHRFLISAYVRNDPSFNDEPYYFLEDRYMTVHRYDTDEKADVLEAEKQEIRARLRRAKAERQKQR